MCDKKENFLQSVGDDSYRDKQTIPAHTPSSIVYPKAYLYHAFAEDIHPMKRIDAASNIFKEERFLLGRKRIQDFQTEDEAMSQYLRKEPTSFIIFGKPGLDHIDVASAIADTWNCILISPLTLIRQEIDMDTEKGRCIERILRAGGCIGPEIFMDLIRCRVRMRDVRHRGYVVAGLPLLPPTISFDSSHSVSDAVSDNSEICGKATVETCKPQEDPNTSDNSGCKTQIDHEQQISQVVDEIFTVWPMKPLIIIYLMCPSEDIASKCSRRYMEIGTDKAVEAESATQVNEVEDGIEYDVQDPSYDFSDITNKDKNDKDKPYFMRQSCRKEYIEAECYLYEQLALPVIDKWILAHDPQHVIRVDGRNSVRWILEILKTRLCTLALQPSILPKRMIERHDIHFVETSEMNDELAEKSVEEAFEILKRREIVSPRFPWGLSAWKFYCPVKLAQGRTVKGLPKHAVRFLNKIFFLSSGEAENLFVENPRTFLSSPNPRPICKIAVFGPRYAGKSELSARLAKDLGGAIINVNEIVDEFIKQREESQTLHENDSVVQGLLDHAERTRDESIDMSVDEKADIIIQNIKSIPDEIEDDLRRDGGYIVDGMYVDIEVWRKVVDDANIVFEDIIVLFEEAPYTYLLNKLHGFFRSDSIMDADHEEFRENEEWDYLEHLTQFESNWKTFEKQISEFGGNVIKCNLADIKDVAQYVINHIRHRFSAIETTINAKEENEENENLDNAVIVKEKTDLVDKEFGKGEQKHSAFTVDLETAERLLECGYYFLSSFGRWCPVQMYTNEIPIQMFLPMRARGQIFPVVHHPYIYFLGGEKAFSAFLDDPLKWQTFVAQNLSLSPVPLRISIIGPPNCGKTTLANRFAETYGMEVINAAEALHNMLKYYHWLESVRIIEDQLQTGQPARIESITRAIEMCCLGLRATTQGYILDDFPFSQKQAELLAVLGIQPMIVLYLKTDLQDCREYFTQDNDNAKRPQYFYANFQRQYYASEKDQASFPDWLKKFSQNLVELDATKSKWYVWTHADRAVRSRFAEIMLYLRDVDVDKVHRLRYMCVSPFEFQTRQSQYKSYCPVCLSCGNILKTSGELVDAEGMVQFREYFYWICPQHLDAFVKDPLQYLPPNNVALPDELPRILWETVDAEHACWARRLQADGLCLVTYVDSLPDDRKLIQGRADLGVIFADKVYLFCSEECREKFLAQPVKYSKVNITVPREITPIDVRRLSDVSFLKTTVSRMLIEAVNLTVKHRPKIFGLSAAASAAIYIGVYLKRHNISESVTEADIYQNVNNRITKEGRIIEIVTDTMKRKLNPYVSLPKYCN
ncbi:hypothetical protein DMN91_010128 [Ooceraea biroi]|uniref:Adenylate kinase 9 n=2 Tax=Ooceraea biroi TaxID=2015173 RepID=A0A3L8DDC2_OOCBI|nr:hypothetical protein DMN91_010128 [Ooceraea biroi]